MLELVLELEKTFPGGMWDSKDFMEMLALNAINQFRILSLRPMPGEGRFLVPIGCIQRGR